MKDLKKIFQKLYKNFWPVLLILITVSSFFWKVFIKGEVPFPGDFVVGIYYPWLDYKWGYLTGVPVKNPIIADVPSFIYPMQTFAVDSMKSGKWPLWNPLILGGVPLLANFQSAPFTPTVLFYFLFGKITAWTLQIIISHLLAAIFTFLLLREWKVSKIGSIVGGIIFAFSGYNLIWSQWNGHTLAAAFIPLILLFEDKWLKKQNIFDGLGISISFCIQIFSGYPQTLIYTAVAIAMLWLVRVFGQEKIIFKTIFLIFFFFLGIGLAAPQVLTGRELLSLSQWMSEPHPYEWAFLPWKKIITFLVPDYFGNHVTRNYWGPQDYTSNTGFVGVIAFTLALLGIALGRKKKEVVFSISLLVTTLLISFPTIFSIFLWRHNLFGMRSSSAHRALVLFNLATALLAGFGLDFLRHKFKLKSVLVAMIIPASIIIVFGIYAINLKGVIIRGIPISTVAVRNLVLPFVFLISMSLVMFLKPKFRIISVLICVFELFWFGWKFTPFSPTTLVYPKTPVLEFLSSLPKPFRITGSKVIPVNLAMPYGFESLEGYETMRPLRISQFLASINKNNSFASPAGRYGIIDNDTSRLLDLVNTKYYLALKNDIKRFDRKRFSPVFEDKSVVVLESRSVLPRAFMAYDWEVEKDEKQMVNRLLDQNFNFSKKILLEENPISMNRFIDTKVYNKVSYINYSTEESLLDIETDKDGLLFVSDSWYPGWMVYIDGKEGKIYRADFAFRAIEVPKGQHTIKFIYRPKSFYDGLKISLVSLTFLIILIIFRNHLNKRGIKHYT